MILLHRLSNKVPSMSETPEPQACPVDDGCGMIEDVCRGCAEYEKCKEREEQE